MKKPDEIALYAYLRTTCSPRYTVDAAVDLGIPLKRANDLVRKWCDNGWCVAPRSGCVYFFNCAPTALLPWGTVK